MRSMDSHNTTVWYKNLDCYILISVTILFIPFFGLKTTIDPVLMPQFFVWAVVLLVLFVLLTLRIFGNPMKADFGILQRGIFISFLAYFLFAVVSLVQATNKTEGIYEVLRISLCIVYLFLMTIVLSRDKCYLLFSIKAVTVTALILSTITIYQYFLCAFSKSGIQALSQVCATMANKNLLSSALFLMLPFCLYTLFVYRGLFRLLGFVSTLLSLLGILLLQTRTVWVALSIASLTTIILFIYFNKKSSGSVSIVANSANRLLSIVMVVIVAFVLFGCLYLRSNSIESLSRRIESIFTDTGARVPLWTKSLNLVKDNPLLGVGAGNWKIVFPSYGIDGLPPQLFLRVQHQSPHNDYIWVFSEIGIMGLLSYLFIFFFVIIYILRILKNCANNEDKLLSVLIFFGIIGYMVISFFDFPKERISHSIILLLMVAIILSIYHRLRPSHKQFPRGIMFGWNLICTVLLCSAVIIGYIRLNAEVHTKRALAARYTKDWGKVTEEIDKGYSIFATLDPTLAPLKWYRGEANFLSGRVPEAFKDYKDAYKAHPYHIHVLNNLATCYELAGDHNQAIFYYRKALNIYPNFDRALINLGATYNNIGKYNDAYETLLRCDPNTDQPELKEYLRIVSIKLAENKL
jgi:O-antigen ligase